MSKQPGKHEDLSGRDRIVKNVLHGWLAQSVFIIAGFVMPRLIDSYIGQTNLGIWDFSWSLVNYLSLSGLGVGSSVNRYVAKYRASNDFTALSKSISSVMLIQGVITLFVITATLVLLWCLPVLFKQGLGDQISSTRWVVGFLGFSLAVQMAFDTCRGIITGSHRWDLHNWINSFSRAMTIGLMWGALVLGYGLKGMSIIYFAVVVVTELVRWRVAFNLCPQIRLNYSYISRAESWKMLLFGAKTVFASLPPFIIIQTTNIFILQNLGPGILAVFSRSIALTRHVETFMNRFSFVLTPTASSLQGIGKDEEIADFLISATTYCAAFAVPATLLLVIDGDILLRIWMGPDYINGNVLPIIALGSFLPISQSSTLRILIGLNRHGYIGAMTLMVAILSFSVGTTIVFVTGWSVTKAALVVGISYALSSGMFLPIASCRALKIPLMNYYMKSFLTPISGGALFAMGLISGKVFWPENHYLALLTGIITGLIMMTIVYWNWLLPQKSRQKILCYCRSKLFFNKKLGPDR